MKCPFYYVKKYRKTRSVHAPDDKKMPATAIKCNGNIHCNVSLDHEDDYYGGWDAVACHYYCDECGVDSEYHEKLFVKFGLYKWGDKLETLPHGIDGLEFVLQSYLDKLE